MSKNVHTEAVNHLFDAILSLENKEECYRFFEDVCTVNELLSLSQRYEVAECCAHRKPISTLRKRPELLLQRSAVSTVL
mgnify:CR=1 FL=1